MKKVVRLFLLLGILIASTSIFAKPVSVELQMISLKSMAISEKDSDEIYISVTQNDVITSHESQRTPSDDKYWTFKVGTTISDKSLWKKPLKDGDSKTLNIAVVERDPFIANADDLIGYITVQIKNVKNKIEASWSIPETKYPNPTIEIGKNKYRMSGDNSSYEVSFAVKSAK